MVSDFSIGTLLAFGAATLFGVHTSFAKTKSVMTSGVDMSIYNIYFLIGAALTCFIEYCIMMSLGTTIEFTYLGIICAFLLLCFETFLLLSIQQIGVGYATGFSVFSSSVITPILQIILGQPIAVWWIMVIGLAMLAFSVFLMSILRDALKFCGLASNPAEATRALLETSSEMAVNVDENSPLVDSDGQVPSPANADAAAAGNSEMKISRCSMVVGLIFSSLAGIFMAVLPLPSLYAEPAAAGLNFFLSFGVGCVIVIPLSAVISLITSPRGDYQEIPDGDKDTKANNRVQGLIPFDLLYKLVTFDDDVWHFKEVVIPAVSAGVVWSIGNICGFCSFMYLSYTIAVSFVQCNVIVAMLLAVILWKEVTNKLEILMLAFLSLVLVGGCAVVVYGVFGSF